VFSRIFVFAAVTTVPVMAEQTEEQAENEKNGPSDLEKGLMLFQSAVKTHKASRRLGKREAISPEEFASKRKCLDVRLKKLIESKQRDSDAKRLVKRLKKHLKEILHVA